MNALPEDTKAQQERTVAFQLELDIMFLILVQQRKLLALVEHIKSQQDRLVASKL
jgi:hypothetical protein